MTTYDQSDRYALRALEGTNPISDIDAGFVALRDDVSAKLTEYTAGVRASRPVSTPGLPGIPGRTYCSTDDGGLDLDRGTSWKTLAPGLFATLPTGGAIDANMEILYQTAAMATAGVGPWHLRYNSALSGTSKWKVIAADPLSAELEPAVTTTSASMSNSGSNPGSGFPAITAPVAGVYDIRASATVFSELANGLSSVGVKCAGGSGAENPNISHFKSTAAFQIASIGRNLPARVIPSSDLVIALTYAHALVGGYSSFENRAVTATPLRIG